VEPNVAAYSLADLLGQTAQPQPSARQQGRERAHSPRSKNRAGAWAEDLGRWYAYHLGRTTTDAQRAEVDAEYQRRLEHGPDWQHYRAHSDYSAPHVHQLTAEDRRAALAAFDAVADWLYAQRTPGDHSQRVSGHYRDVFRYLLNTAMRFGQAFPSYTRIAERCQCSRRTVASALAWLRLWGLLDWQRRIRRTAAGVVRQTTNGYRLLVKGLAAIGAKVFGKSECKSLPALANPIIAANTAPLFADAT
jgi:hypothetical protein